jgi:hypothetical protein
MKRHDTPEPWAVTRLPAPPRGRLRKLLPALDPLAPPRPDTPLSPDDWLGLFTLYGRDVLAEREPDFPRALRLFRDAPAAAKVSSGLPYDPPASFRSPAVTRAGRAADWRSVRRFPAVWTAWVWPAEMTDRAMNDIPPVTEAEFAELKEWFTANESVLLARGELATLNGERVELSRVRRGLARGPREMRAGRVAE